MPLWICCGFWRLNSFLYALKAAREAISIIRAIGGNLKMVITVIDENPESKNIPCEPLDKLVERLWFDGCGAKVLYMENGGIIEFVKTPLHKNFLSCDSIN